MRRLEDIKFYKANAKKELKSYWNFLKRNVELNERDQILPFFNKRKYLSAFIGQVIQKIEPPDMVSHEYPLWGEYVCDLVVGSKISGSVCFVEFEDGKRNSIFSGSGNNRTWSSRFEHGYSQIIDWFNVLDLQREHLNRELGFEIKSYSGILVIGRKRFLDPKEIDRMIWRSGKVRVDSKDITIVDYDNLFEILKRRL
jgi:hypothetical protein